MSTVTNLKLAIIGGTLALLLTTGCGGSGAASTPLSSTAFKESVMSSLEQGFQAKSGSSQAGQSSRQSRVSENVYFDEYYELWAEQGAGVINYFVDEALTQPAGQQTYSFGTSETGVLTKKSSLEITAGKFKGLTQILQIVVEAESFNFIYSGNNPDTGEYSAIGSYKNGTSQTNVKYKDENGKDRTYSVVSNPDGTSRVEFNTGSNFVYALNYASDGSGTGTVTGTNELLPATITWNTSGDGQVTFADATLVSFTDFNFVQI
jgi:hypothetical protein